jgi:hypothetical protein
MTIRSRLGPAAIAIALAVTGFAVAFGAVPAAANSATNCSSGYFCFYASTGFGGSRGTQFAYTSGWVRMSSLVDDSEWALRQRPQPVRVPVRHVPEHALDHVRGWFERREQFHVRIDADQPGPAEHEQQV